MTRYGGIQIRARAQFLGAFRVCADVGIGGGPLLIGALTAAASLTAAALTIGAVGLAAALLLHRWLSNPPGSAPAPNP